MWLGRVEEAVGWPTAAALRVVRVVRVASVVSIQKMVKTRAMVLKVLSQMNMMAPVAGESHKTRRETAEDAMRTYIPRTVESAVFALSSMG